MTTTPSWLTFLPLVALGVVILIGLLNHAKKFLDNDKDYADKVDVVVSANRVAASTRLRWIADDMSNPQSRYSMATLDSEDYVYHEATTLMVLFKRIRGCRKGMKRARFGLETVKWSCIVGFVAAALYVASNAFQWSKPLILAFACLGGAAVLAAIAGFIYAEVWFQVIRKHYDKSKDLDAAIPS